MLGDAQIVPQDDMGKVSAAGTHQFDMPDSESLNALKVNASSGNIPLSVEYGPSKFAAVEGRLAGTECVYLAQTDIGYVLRIVPEAAFVSRRGTGNSIGGTEKLQLEDENFFPKVGVDDVISVSSWKVTPIPKGRIVRSTKFENCVRIVTLESNSITEEF